MAPGFDTLTWCLAVEELSRACTPLANTVVLAQMTTTILLNFGNDTHRKEVLPAIATGQSVCSFGLTEPDAGSDAASIRTTARQDGDDWVISGQKMFTTGSEVADWIIVAASIDRSLGSKGIRCFLVPRHAKGVEVGKRISMMGVRGEGACPVFF